MLDTPEQIRAFLDQTPGDAVLLIGEFKQNAPTPAALASLPVAHTRPRPARAVFEPELFLAPDMVTAIYLQHGQRVSTARLSHPDALPFTLARHFRNTAYAPIIMTPHEPCRGIGHIHVHVSTCMVIPRFVKASSHMRVLHKLLQYPLLLERVCLHQDLAPHAEPWLANDLGHRLVGAPDILAFLAGMRVAWRGSNLEKGDGSQKKGVIEINASFAGHAPVRVRDGGLPAAS
jgi:hypothetical protein